MSKISDYINELTAYVQGVEILNSIQFASNQMLSSIKNRIFESQGGGEDINGVNFGGYSTEYKKTRLKNKRQALNKDFNLTDTLVNSLKLGITREKGSISFVIYIDGKRNQDVAGYLTEETKKLRRTGIIFQASKSEIEERDKVIRFLINQSLKEIGAKYE